MEIEKINKIQKLLEDNYNEYKNNFIKNHKFQDIFENNIALEIVIADSIYFLISHFTDAEIFIYSKKIYDNLNENNGYIPFFDYLVEKFFEIKIFNFFYPFDPIETKNYLKEISDLF